MNQRKIGTILSYLNIFLSNTISLIYTPYMLNMLGKSEYGIYGTAQSFISYLTILNFGIGGAYIKFNSQCRSKNDKDEENRLNGMFISIFTVLSLLVFIGGLLLIFSADTLMKNTYSSEELYKLKVVMFILTINMVITFMFNVISMALISYEKFIFIKSIVLITGIITPIINVMALNSGGKAITITLISFIISFLSYIIYFIYARKKINFKISFHGLKKDVFKELFTFSFFLFINSITDQITFSTDSIILSAVKGASASAIYTVGSNFKGYFLSFSSNISSVFAPQINMIVAKTKDMNLLNEIFIRIGRIQFYVISLIMIGYICIGKSFIMLWAGPDYKDSFWIGILLMGSVFVPAFQNIGLEIQKALNRHKARSVVYFIIALANVIISIPFSIKFGGIGAAAVTFVCMFIGTVIFMNIYYKVKINLDITKFWKSILSIIPSYTPAIIVGILINKLITLDSYVEILLSALVITITFILSIWKFSMNKYEKDLILTPIKKFTKKGNKNVL